MSTDKKNQDQDQSKKGTDYKTPEKAGKMNDGLTNKLQGGSKKTDTDKA